MLEQVGNWGYQVGAAGIVAFTVAFLVIVPRWWKDTLGRCIGSVFITTCALLVMSTVRMLNPDMGGVLYIWRIVIYWAFALSVWSSIGAFLWAQFRAPRIRTTRRETHEEADPGRSLGDRDGDPDYRAGRVH